jgi:hypothetical protein
VANPPTSPARGVHQISYLFQLLRAIVLALISPLLRNATLVGCEDEILLIGLIIAWFVSVDLRHLR